jgi:putative zinc finger protein
VTCPDMMLLSQLLDEELAPAEAASLRSHVGTCAACHERIRRLEHAAAAWRTATTARSPQTAPRPSADCLEPTRLAAWAARAESPDDVPAVEAHLESCDTCLGEAIAMTRLVARLDAGTTLAVPGALQARVGSLWPAAPSGPSLSALVIQVARTGVALLERHVVAPVLEIEDLSAAVPAVRGGEGHETVSFSIRAPDAQIRATVFAEGANVGLTLKLLGNGDDALGGQRIFLRQHGRSIYSARTDAAGGLTMPRMKPGVYEVFCPGIGTSFRLDLRP